MFQGVIVGSEVAFTNNLARIIDGIRCSDYAPDDGTSNEFKSYQLPPLYKNP